MIIKRKIKQKTTPKAQKILKKKLSQKYVITCHVNTVAATRKEHAFNPKRDKFIITNGQSINSGRFSKTQR